MNDNYTIYKAENLFNGQVYIGATTYSLMQIKLDHIERANRGEVNKFHEAISLYGTNAFSWEQIDTAESNDELALKEKKYVLEYNAKEKGYNSDEGGGFKKTVYQYNLKDGSLLNSYSCLDEAKESIKSTKQRISQACLSVNNLLAGYYWSYEIKEPFIPSNDKRKKKVIQLDLDDNLIAEFNSVAEASISTGNGKSGIAKVCRGEQEHCGGYKWRYL